MCGGRTSRETRLARRLALPVATRPRGRATATGRTPGEAPPVLPCRHAPVPSTARPARSRRLLSLIPSYIRGGRVGVVADPPGRGPGPVRRGRGVRGPPVRRRRRPPVRRTGLAPPARRWPGPGIPGVWPPARPAVGGGLPAERRPAGAGTGRGMGTRDGRDRARRRRGEVAAGAVAASDLPGCVLRRRRPAVSEFAADAVLEVIGTAVDAGDRVRPPAPGVGRRTRPPGVGGPPPSAARPVPAVRV